MKRTVVCVLRSKDFRYDISWFRWWSVGRIESGVKKRKAKEAHMLHCATSLLTETRQLKSIIQSDSQATGKIPEASSQFQRSQLARQRLRAHWRLDNNSILLTFLRRKSLILTDVTDWLRSMRTYKHKNCLWMHLLLGFQAVPKKHSEEDWADKTHSRNIKLN